MFRRNVNNSHQVELVRLLIDSVNRHLDQYISEGQAQLNNLHEKKTLTKKRHKKKLNTSNDSFNNLATGVVKIILPTVTSSLKHSIELGFYSKIDLNEELSKKKIALAQKIKFDILELQTDAPLSPPNLIKLLRGVVLHLLMAKEENQIISGKLTIGTRGKFEVLLENQLTLIKNAYPQVVAEAQYLHTQSKRNFKN